MKEIMQRPNKGERRETNSKKGKICTIRKQMTCREVCSCEKYLMQEKGIFEGKREIEGILSEMSRKVDAIGGIQKLINEFDVSRERERRETMTELIKYGKKQEEGTVESK